MKKTPKNARRADGVLSPEELQKAIEEYKARRAAKAAPVTDGDEPAKEATPDVGPTVPASDSDDLITPADQDEPTIEEQLAEIKENRDRRDAEGDPEDVEAAKTLIEDQDDDIGILCDIIDTLLAQKEFDEGEPTQEPVQEPEAEPVDKAADGDDECTTEQDSEDDDIPNSTAADESLMNADSIDAIVRQRIQLGMVGRSLNLDGLESMSIMRAKKAVIAAVRPNMRLDGKSATFVNAAYEMAAAEVTARCSSSVPIQKKQMFNKDSRTAGASGTGDSSVNARKRMMDRMMNNKKEDK